MLRLPRRVFCVAATLALASLSVNARQTPGGDPRVEAIRYWSFGDVTRIAIETQGDYKITSDSLAKPPRLFFDLRGLRPPASKRKGMQIIQVNDHRVKQIRVAETEPGVTRIVLDLAAPSDFTSSQLVTPDRLIIELHPKGSGTAEPAISRTISGVERVRLDESDTISTTSQALPPITGVPAEPTRLPFVSQPDLWALGGTPPYLPYLVASQSPTIRALLAADTPRPVRWNTTPPRRSPAVDRVESATASPARKSVPALDQMTPAQIDGGNRSLVRVFGLKIHKVVIDAGHGGHDTGTIGPGGLMEKDLVLDVALRLGKLVQQQLGAEVVYTRSDDTFIPLEERTKLANAEKADLFISVHANSSPAPSATGVETYYFNFTADKGSLDIATRENATSNSSIYQLNDLLKKAVLNAKVEESREFAQKVQSALFPIALRMNRSAHDRGVRKAPFVVLIGATMPSILAEIGFVSNPRDEKQLRRDDQRQKIANALYKGVAAYANSLSHVEMARSRSNN